MQSYQKHKDVSAEWVKTLPCHWSLAPFLFCCAKNIKKNKNLIIEDVLSLSYGNVILKDSSKNFGLMPENYSSYQILEPGDIVMRLTDLQNDHVSLRTGLVKNKGIITSAYLGLKIKRERINEQFFHWLLHSYDLQKVFYAMGGGIRQTVGYDELKWLPIVIPGALDQQRISDFLDEKTSKIDKIIKEREKLAKLLNEKCVSIITNAVTKGISKNAKMAEFGLDWIKNIPEGWEIKKIKYIASLKTGNSIPDEEKGIYDIDNNNKSYPYISSKDISLEFGDVNYDSGIYIPKNNNSFKIARKDSILLCIEGGSAGSKVGFVSGDVCYVNKLCNINSNSCDNEYIYYFCKSKVFKDMFDLSLAGLIGGVSVQNLKQLLILVPSMETQKEIAHFLNKETGKINKLIKATREQIKKLKEYRSSLIYNAVTGKIKI